MTFTPDGGFDNRGKGEALSILFGQRRPGLHLSTNIDGRMLTYCYIRKNACSAFKKLFLEQLPEKPQGVSSIRHMGKHQRRHWMLVSFSEITVFVYRDPFERLASLYINKFIQRSGSQGIERNYRKLTNREPEDASFVDFVTNYSSQKRQHLDPHLWSQKSHLLPIRYSHAIPIGNLRGGMAELIGEPAASRYFGVPANMTSQKPVETVENAETLTAGFWIDLFNKDGVLPTKASLLTPQMRQAIAKIYSEDLIFSNDRRINANPRQDR